MLLAVIKYLVDFEFVIVIDGDWVRWGSVQGAVFDGFWWLIWAENGYVKDWVYLKSVQDVEFVGHGRDFLGDAIRTDEAVLEFL